jgi:phosphate starvation-inducible PhoH-like protein
MIEKLIYLDGIDPINLYGINNLKFEKIKAFFSKLKVIARGHEIKVIGEAAAVKDFEEKIELLVEHFNRYHNLTDENISDILGNGNSSKLDEADDSVLLYGVTGKAIKARTKHQQDD